MSAVGPMAEYISADDLAGGMRSFVAVDLPAPSEGRNDPGRAPNHVTLLFLGEIARERVGTIGERLRDVAQRHGPFGLTIEGVGAFPSAHAPRVVWLGMTGGARELERLAEDVRSALHDELPRPPEERFVPHVTLFRVRSPGDRRAAVDLLEGRSAAPAPRTVRVEEFLLKESLLGRGGAVHRTLAAFRLGGPGPPYGLDRAAGPASFSFRQR